MSCYEQRRLGLTREALLERYRVRDRATAPQRRLRTLARRYGLSEFGMARLKQLQGGVCAICKKEPEQWHVDHDHRLRGRAALRGLLCERCNHMLGHAKDSVATLAAAIVYLHEPPARSLDVSAEA